MTIKGILADFESGQYIDGVVTISRNGENVLTLETINGEFIIEDLLSTDTLTASALNYRVGVWSVGSLDTANDNFLLLKSVAYGTGVDNHTGDKNKNLFPLALIATAALLLVRKKKKVGVTTSELAPYLLIAVGVLGFSFVKQFLEKLGIWDSRDTKDLDADATNPASAWSPIFWHNKPPNIPYSYAITSTVAQSYAREIYDAFGAFNDCEECVKAVIRRLRTKANLSFLAENFANVYGQDLLSFLRGGNWPQDRLSDSDVNELNQYIKNLPDY